MKARKARQVRGFFFVIWFNNFFYSFFSCSAHKKKKGLSGEPALSKTTEIYCKQNKVGILIVIHSLLLLSVVDRFHLARHNLKNTLHSRWQEIIYFELYCKDIPSFKELKGDVVITEKGIWSDFSHRINQLKVTKLRTTRYVTVI